MIGNGIAGIIVGGLRMATVAVFPGNEAGLEYATILYFALGAGIILLCIAGFYAMLRTPYAMYALAEREEAAAKQNSKAGTVGAVGANWRVVLYKLWQEAYMVCWVFFVTLALFPGMTLEFVNTSHVLSKNWCVVVVVVVVVVESGVSLSRSSVVVNPFVVLNHQVRHHHDLFVPAV